MPRPVSVTATLARSSSRTDLDAHRARAVHGLNGIEQQVQKNLVNLIAVVFDFRQIGRFLQLDLDGLGHHLLAGQHDRVFDRGIEIAAAHLRRMGPRRFQQIGHDAVDLRDFLADVFDDGARRAGRGQIAADDFDDAGDSGQRIANLVGQAGGQLAERGQVFGAGHLGAMQASQSLRGSRATAAPCG